MKLVLKSKPKRRPNPSRRKNGKVFRFLKRLDNGDLLLFGFVPRYKKDYGKNGGIVWLRNKQVGRWRTFTARPYRTSPSDLAGHRGR